MIIENNEIDNQNPEGVTQPIEMPHLRRLEIFGYSFYRDVAPLGLCLRRIRFLQSYHPYGILTMCSNKTEMQSP